MEVMWLLFNDGLVSVGPDFSNPDRLLIRARRRQDLLNICGSAMEVIEDAVTDYHFRASVERKVFARLVAERIETNTCPNFMVSVKSAALHDLYMRFWRLHYEYQEQGRKAETKEHASRPAEERRKDREEVRQLWRDTQRHIAELSMKITEVDERLGQCIEEFAGASRLADQRLEERLNQLAEQSHAASQELGVRIEKLVSSI